jgi:hypothetical protein
MGIEGDRRKLKKKLGVEFDDERLQIIRDYCKENGVDIVEAGKIYLSTQNEGEYEHIKKYDTDELNLLDYTNEETKNCIEYLFTSWVNQLDASITSNIKITETHHNQIINLFFGVIKKVKNNHLFWAIYGRIFQTYELTSLHLDKFKELVTEDRLKVSLRERTYLSNLLQIFYFNIRKYNKDVDKIKQLNTFDFLYCWKTFNDFVDDICIGSDEDIITIYRGFKVNKNQRILDDEKKQINGQGLSYTIDKDKTIFFGIRYLYYYNLISKLYKGMSKEFDKDDNSQVFNIWKNNLKKLFDKNEIDYKRFEKEKSYRDDIFYESELMNEIRKEVDERVNVEVRDLNIEKNRRGYIGTYTVKKKDIWFLSNIDDEKEIVVSNDKVDVKNYKVITFEDYKKYNLDIKKRHKSFFLESK